MNTPCYRLIINSHQHSFSLYSCICIPSVLSCYGIALSVFNRTQLCATSIIVPTCARVRVPMREVVSVSSSQCRAVSAASFKLSQVMRKRCKKAMLKQGYELNNMEWERDAENTSMVSDGTSN